MHSPDKRPDTTPRLQRNLNALAAVDVIVFLIVVGIVLHWARLV